jgi:EmrB/QacA subfamily drug resistance transporter
MTADPHPHHPEDRRPLGKWRWGLLALLAVAQFMLILDVTVVAIALPSLAADLGQDRSALTWVVSAYTLMFGGMLLLGGRSADLFGSRIVVLTGLALFTCASLVSGLATSQGVLIGGRAAQGLGAALLSPAALSVVVKTFQGEELNRALGVWSALGACGAAVGVLVGGVLTSSAGWRWVFFVNVPIGLVVFLLLARLVPADRPAGARGRIDVLGALLVTAGTGAAVFGIIQAGEAGVLSAGTIVPLLAAALLYAGFVVRQRTAAVPLLDLGILVRRSVASGTLLIFLATALTIAVFFLGSFYLQHYRHLSPLDTGLLFLPVGVGTVVGAQVAGRLIGPLGSRSVGAVGLLVAAAGIAVPVLVDATAGLVAGISVAAVGLGAVFVAASTTALARVQHHEAGLASGILSTFHEFGAAFGVATTSSLAAASITGSGGGGFGWALGFAAVAAAAGALLSWVAIPARGAAG